MQMIQNCLKTIALLLLSVSLLACASLVRTDISTFSKDSSSISTGTIRVIAADKDETESLEFDYFKGKLENRLQSAGYTPVDSDDAEFIATLSYGVIRQEKDKPSSRVVIGGHFGHYPHYPHAPVFLSDFDYEEFEYVRELSLNIEGSQETSTKLLQIKATSIGQCEHLTVVYDEMLEAIFRNLHRANGSVEKVLVRGEARCP